MLLLVALLVAQTPSTAAHYWRRESDSCVPAPVGLTPSTSCTLRFVKPTGRPTATAIDTTCGTATSRLFVTRLACVAASEPAGLSAAEVSEVEALKGCLEESGIDASQPVMTADAETIAGIDGMSTICACTAPGVVGISSGATPDKDMADVTAACLRQQGFIVTPAQLEAMRAFVNEKMPPMAPPAPPPSVPAAARKGVPKK